MFALALELRAAPPPHPAAAPIISVQTPACYQPVPEANACYINWAHVDVASDSTLASYIVAISITVDSRLRAYHMGFFQTTAQLDPGLRGAGLKVSCGPRRVDGMGNTYLWQIGARNSNAQSSLAEGTVLCPGTYLDYLPMLRR